MVEKIIYQENAIMSLRGAKYREAVCCDAATAWAYIQENAIASPPLGARNDFKTLDFHSDI